LEEAAMGALRLSIRLLFNAYITSLARGTHDPLPYPLGIVNVFLGELVPFEKYV
jgi:hypothetical protein